MHNLQGVLGAVFSIIAQKPTMDNISLCAEKLKNSYAKSQELFDISNVLDEAAKAAPEQVASTFFNALGSSCTRGCKNCLHCTDGFFGALYNIFTDKNQPDELEPYQKYIHLIQTQPLRQKLDRMFERVQFPEDFYRLRFERQDKLHKDNYFINLKSMSSSSPIIYNGAFNSEYSGGGFYIKWRGGGIAVDPGYNFTHEMSKYGLTIYDIQSVIITHDHLDHNSDARFLADLEYQIKKEDPRHIQWYVDASSAKALKLWIDEDDIHIISFEDEAIEDKAISQIESPVPHTQLRPYPTRHIKNEEESAIKKELVYDTGTFGFVLDLKLDSGQVFSLGYTSDTTFFPELPQYLDGVSLLIANISSVYADELTGSRQNELHLGLNGVISLLKGLNKPPKVLALSEFWNGLSDIRYDITRYIAVFLRDFANGQDWTIIPLESGTELSLPEFNVRCSSCGQFAKRIYMLRPEEDFKSIRMLCEECVF